MGETTKKDIESWVEGQLESLAFTLDCSTDIEEISKRLIAIGQPPLQPFEEPTPTDEDSDVLLPLEHVSGELDELWCFIDNIDPVDLPIHSSSGRSGMIHTVLL